MRLSNRQRRIDAEPMENTGRFPLRRKRDDLVVLTESLYPRHRRGFLFPDNQILEGPPGLAQALQHEFGILFPLHEIEGTTLCGQSVYFGTDLAHPLPICRWRQIVIPGVVSLILIEGRVEKGKVYPRGEVVPIQGSCATLMKHGAVFFQ